MFVIDLRSAGRGPSRVDTGRLPRSWCSDASNDGHHAAVVMVNNDNSVAPIRTLIGFIVKCCSPRICGASYQKTVNEVDAVGSSST